MSDSKTATWYEVNPYRDEIKTVEVVKETAKCVVVRQKRWSLSGTGNAYRECRRDKADTFFPTQQAAIAFLIAKNERKVEDFSNKLGEAKAALKRLRALAHIERQLPDEDGAL